MEKASSFPHISSSEFASACKHLAEIFERNRTDQPCTTWLSCSLQTNHGTQYLKIEKSLPSISGTKEDTIVDAAEIEDDSDSEALAPPNPTPTLVYTITHSPSYSVPSLYISIRDPLFRYPPTQETLYKHIIPARFRTQTEDERIGVLGGISLTVSRANHTSTLLQTSCLVPSPKTFLLFPISSIPHLPPPLPSTELVSLSAHPLP